MTLPETASLEIPPRPRRRSRIVVYPCSALVLIVLVVAGGWLWGWLNRPPECNPGEDARTCMRILFIGNSYTYVNDLPGTFARLAASGGHRVGAKSLASGGATLSDHVADPDTAANLGAEPWAYVVLQEQSNVPAQAPWRDGEMYPSARTLTAEVKDRGATPLFFMTWAHRDGWPEEGQDYSAMQLSVDKAYTGIARELGVPVAPVGYAWSIVRLEHPGIQLWQSDGSHPSQAGTYLAACVFYATIFRESPAGLSYHDGLSDGDVRDLQSTAGSAVLDLPDEWNLR